MDIDLQIPEGGIPQVLEDWVWASHLSHSAERVLRVHWAEGRKQGGHGGNWITQISREDVARRIGASVATVDRAYKTLEGMGLVRRYAPPKVPNAHRESIVKTEVLIPEALLSSVKDPE